MLSTKARNTIITGLVTLGVAVPAVVPAVSQAQGKDGGTHAALCETYRLTSELWGEAAEQALDKGEYDLSDYYTEKSDEAFRAAKAEGCAWASTIVHPKSNPPVSSKVILSSKALKATS